MLTETDRARRHCPTGASFVHAYRATAFRMLGRHAEEQAEARLIPPVLKLSEVSDFY